MCFLNDSSRLGWTGLTVAVFLAMFLASPRSTCSRFRALYVASVRLMRKISDFDKNLSVDMGALSGFVAAHCSAPLSVTVGN